MYLIIIITWIHHIIRMFISLNHFKNRKEIKMNLLINFKIRINKIHKYQMKAMNNNKNKKNSQNKIKISVKVQINFNKALIEYIKV